MKRFLCLALIAVLCAGLAIPMASAEEAVYSTTKQYTDFLDGKGVDYTYHGMNDNNDERITVDVDENGFSYMMIYFFPEKQTPASIRVWYLITYDKADEAKVIELCNKFNYNYKYVTFIADPSDNTITVRADVIHRSTDMNDALWTTANYMMNIIKDAYPELEPYSVD